MTDLEKQKQRLGLQDYSVLQLVELLRTKHFIYVWSEYTIKGFAPVTRSYKPDLYFDNIIEALEFACAMELSRIKNEEIQITAIGNHYGNLELLKDGESYYMRMQDCESQEWRMIPRKLAKHLIKYQNLVDCTGEIEEEE